MVELFVIAGFVVLTVSFVAARSVKRAAALELPVVADEDLEAFAARLVEIVSKALRAESVAFRRATSLAEIAARGRSIDVRDAWLEEVKAAHRAVTIDTTTVLPVAVKGEVEALLLVDGPMSAVDRARIQALLGKVAPQLATALDRPTRSTMRLIALAQSSDLDTVFEAIADGVAVTDDEGSVVRVNAAGRTILDSAQEGDRNPLTEALRGGQPTMGMEVAIFGNTSTGSVIDLKMSKLSRSPSSRAVVAVLRDITRSRILEHELREQSSASARHVAELEGKQKEIEAATRHKSEFLANMSHELRTPLNGIIGFTEILLEGTYGAMNAKQAECARDVLDGGRHLLALINDILDVSKIEAGKLELAKEDVPIDTLVTNALTLVRPQAGNKQLEITTEVERDVSVHGDPSRIVQILLNLLSNAVKFTPAAGRVRLEVRSSGRMVRVSVTDSGVGIAEEDQGKLFKDFSQVDGSITRRFGGTGLGLTICKRLVELHGGKIGFTSKLGEGSTFWFELSRSQRSERVPFALPSVLRRSSSVPHMRAMAPTQSALVVDADGPSRRIAARALRDAGIATVEVASLAQARAFTAENQPVAVVIDPVVGDATEKEAMEFAVHQVGTSVIATSTRSASEMKTTLPEGVAFVQKPVDRGLLADEVSRAIARRSEKRRTALVIDGHDDGREVVALLQAEGFRVDHASTLAAAHKRIARGPTDLIVLELDLPDGDGLELVRGASDRGSFFVLTNRSLEGAAGDEVRALCKVAVQKGALSRTAFTRRVEELLQPEAPGRARVLAVDDNEQNLRLITALLSARGYHVIETRDAISAIEYARAEKPDVVLMDVMLPGVDGLSATRMLASDPRTRDIPVIAISANAMAEDHAKARAAGCCAYVTKPVDSRSLLAILGGVLHGKFSCLSESGSFA
jgi:signal transduction histidine kinase/DNA-binding response OmpR family regulator